MALQGQGDGWGGCGSVRHLKNNVSNTYHDRENSRALDCRPGNPASRTGAVVNLPKQIVLGDFAPFAVTVLFTAMGR